MAIENEKNDVQMEETTKNLTNAQRIISDSKAIAKTAVGFSVSVLKQFPQSEEEIKILREKAKDIVASFECIEKVLKRYKMKQ